jgi:MFS superfamily sulfate permease-like transporter
VGIVVLLALERLAPRIPAYLVWVALSIGAAAAFGLGDLGVALIGAVPSGLPSLAVPDLSLAPLLWPGAVGIALMSFTESTAAARAFAHREDGPVNANQELTAVGAANIASALVGGMPSGGGTSQTAVADKAGARSQMAQWVNAAAVLATLLFLSSVIGLMPKAALGALIIVASASMIKPAKFRAIARIRRTELAWALVTFAGVVFIGTLQGILIAVVISVLTLMVQANHPPVYQVAYDREKGIFRRAGEDENDETFSGLLILRTEGRLTFANVDRTREKMQVLVTEVQPQVIVLECSAIPDIEYTALVKVDEAEEALSARGVTLWLAAVNPDLLKRIQSSPLGERLGRDRMFFNLYKVLEAWQETLALQPRKD